MDRLGGGGDAISWLVGLVEELSEMNGEWTWDANIYLCPPLVPISIDFHEVIILAATDFIITNR